MARTKQSRQSQSSDVDETPEQEPETSEGETPNDDSLVEQQQQREADEAQKRQDDENAAAQAKREEIARARVASQEAAAAQKVDMNELVDAHLQSTFVHTDGKRYGPGIDLKVPRAIAVAIYYPNKARLDAWAEQEKEAEKERIAIDEKRPKRVTVAAQQEQPK
jgi:hypothetical protein